VEKIFTKRDLKRRFGQFAQNVFIYDVMPSVEPKNLVAKPIWMRADPMLAALLGKIAPKGSGGFDRSQIDLAQDQAPPNEIAASRMN